MTSSRLWPFSSSAASRQSERQEGRKRKERLSKQGKEGGEERGGEENVDTNVWNKGDEDGAQGHFQGQAGQCRWRRRFWEISNADCKLSPRRSCGNTRRKKEEVKNVDWTSWRANVRCKNQRKWDKEGFCRFPVIEFSGQLGPLETSCLTQTQVVPYIRSRFAFITSPACSDWEEKVLF